MVNCQKVREVDGIDLCIGILSDPLATLRVADPAFARMALIAVLPEQCGAATLVALGVGRIELDALGKMLIQHLQRSAAWAFGVELVLRSPLKPPVNVAVRPVSR